MSKIVNCKSCGAQINSKASFCPYCGVKVKKSILKKLLIALLIIAILAIVVGAILITTLLVNSTNNDNDFDYSIYESDDDTEDDWDISDSSDSEKEYIVCNVTDLFDELNDNALKAEKTYNGQYVEITGHVRTIDSSGEYIGLGADENNYDYLFDQVLCYIRSDEQLDTIMELSSNDVITIKGKIIDVGEISGYSLKIESISIG